MIIYKKIIYKNAKPKVRRDASPAGHSWEYYHSINKIILEKIIKQPRQIHKISRVGHINTRPAPNIDMSHNIPFTTEWPFCQ